MSKNLIWKVDPDYNGLHFFALLAEELLCHFSYDSFKVPTLNFHHLCNEILETIADVDRGLLDKGNIIPLFNEFVDSYEHDPIVADLYGSDVKLVFSEKDKTGRHICCYGQLLSNPSSDSSILRLKLTAQFLYDDLSRNNRYFYHGVEKIRQIVLEKNVEFLQLEKLREYTRIILTELINLGYSQEYLYTCIKKVFFCDSPTTTNAAEIFESFLNHFPLKKREYVIYLPLNNIKIKEELAPFTKIQIADNCLEMFDNVTYVIKMEWAAMDPESAKNSCVALLDFCLSISQYAGHNKRAIAFKCAEVIDIDSKELFRLGNVSPVISRQKRSLVNVKRIAHACFSIGDAMLGAIGMHASAFQTKNTKNQLLNLWTAMEILVPIEQSVDMNKINQISNQAATVLSFNYIKTLIQHFDEQLYKVLGEKYLGILDSVLVLQNERYEKLLALIVLSDFSNEYDGLLAELSQEPLCQYRLQHYRNVLSHGKSIYSFYTRHSQRVAWQINRIYRNRNLIVHNGDSFVFMEVILQNLHYYIDTIIDALYSKFEDGFQDRDSIFTCFLHNEMHHLDKVKDMTTLTKKNYHFAVLGE